MFPENFDEFDGTIELPQFSNLTIIINCVNDDKSGVIFCPPNTRYDYSRCLKYSNDFAYDMSTPSNLAKNLSKSDTLLQNQNQNIPDTFPNIDTNNVLIKQDNMFTAFDGAKGTTLPVQSMVRTSSQ